MTDRLPYRLCAGMMVINNDGLVFVGARLDNKADAWQMPQGGIDEGEDPRQAALRELREEIGTDKVTILAESENWLTYDLPDELYGKMWKGRYGGQKQKWFLMQFTGTDADINIETEHPEFRAWEWAAIDTLPERIVPFKVDLYRQVIALFREKIADATG
ncbi:MAG: RNA pyrophosphohydrolase [Alphaproteobacteria bacterium]|nr:MAG: RNA pyrophosphohydrolase [Alphaproteobacteria bacterium]